VGIKDKVLPEEESNPASEPPKKFKLKPNKVFIILQTVHKTYRNHNNFFNSRQRKHRLRLKMLSFPLGNISEYFNIC
jgi:hypothetical protein